MIPKGVFEYCRYGVDALPLSTRARRLVMEHDCLAIYEVRRLTRETILSWRGAGITTADDIARALYWHDTSGA